MVSVKYRKYLLIMDSDDETDFRESITISHSSPLVKATPKLAPNDRTRLWTYFSHQPLKSLKAITITIGNRHYGKLGYKKQYRLMRDTVRLSLKKKHKYICLFEFQNNGNLHIHGIVENTLYHNTFCEIFSKFGSRNCHEKSFAPISDLKSYWDYIWKDQKNTEQEFIIKPIHNIYEKHIEKLESEEKLRSEASIISMNDYHFSPTDSIN